MVESPMFQKNRRLAVAGGFIQCQRHSWSILYIFPTCIIIYYSTGTINTTTTTVTVIHCLQEVVDVRGRDLNVDGFVG